MKYIFHPEEDMIPKALYEAAMVEPCEEITSQWHEEIYKAENRGGFLMSFKSFISSITP